MEMYKFSERSQNGEGFPHFYRGIKLSQGEFISKEEKKNQNILMRVFAATFLQAALSWSALAPPGSVLAAQILANHF